MSKNVVLSGILVFGVTLFCVQSAFPQTVGTASVKEKKDPHALVLRLKDARVEELKKLSFLELNVLKNAVYASKGYRFADDRPWLNVIYCGEEYYQKKKGQLEKLTGLSIAPLRKSTGDTATAPGGKMWDLRDYQFPQCKESDALDEDQKKAIANIRVAVFKRIEALGSVDAVDTALAQERKNMEKMDSGYNVVIVFGKKIPLPVAARFEASLRRDLHGNYRMLQLMKQVTNFDSMELLGLFAGDIMFLKNVIEAQQGKPFSGVLGWEISQIVGITEQKQDYDPTKLHPAMQERLRSLDEIIGKIMRSDLNDIPASLRSQPIEFSSPYDLEGC